MEINYCPVNNIERIFSETKENNIDCELVLPDYYPAIMKILACSVECFNENVSVSGEKLTVEAFAAIRILYMGEGNKISVFTHEIGFSKSAVFAGCEENDKLSVTHKVNSSATRVTGQRRIEVHAVSSVTFEVDRFIIRNFVAGADSEMLQCRTDSASVFDTAAYFRDTFEVREDCTGELSSESNFGMIRKSALAICNEYKTVKNKLMLKGICEVQLSYSPDGENVTVYRKNIPFTNVFDIVGIREGDECFIALSCENIRLVKSDRSGMESTDICVRLHLNVRCGKCADVSIVTDAYLPNADTDIKIAAENATGRIKVCDSIINTEVVAESYEENVTDIIDCWTEKEHHEQLIENGELHVKGSVTLAALVKTEKDEILCIMRNTSFDTVIDRHGFDNCEIIACLSKNTMSGSVISGGKIALKAELRLVGYLTETKSISGVVSVEAAQDDVAVEANASDIVVYFADEGEILWDIAKKNNTTISQIKRYNESVDEIVKTRTVLILPAFIE